MSQQSSTPGTIEDFQSVMREAVKNWHEQLNGGGVDVAQLQRQVRIYRRQRNFLVSVLVTIAGAYVKRVMDGQVKTNARG